MARSEAKRQKKLAKNKAKRTQKRHEIVRTSQMGLAERLGRLQSAEILDCFINDDFEDQGIANVFIGRRAASGEIGVAVFLVDLYCLGIKNALGKVTTFGEYRDLRDKFEARGVRRIDPPSAHRLILDAVDYAASLGFSPHADFRRVQPILNGIDPDAARETFPMGKNGKPFYVTGPHESEADTRRIIARLQAQLGSDGYHFMTHHRGVIMEGSGGILAIR